MEKNKLTTKIMKIVFAIIISQILFWILYSVSSLWINEIIIVNSIVIYLSVAYSILMTSIIYKFLSL